MLNSAQNKESPITEEEEDVVEREGKDTLSSLPPPEQTGLENRTKSLDRTQLNRRSPERVQAIRSEHMSQRRMNSLDSVVGGARHVTNPQIKPTSSTAEGATGAVDEKAQEMVPGRAAGEEEEEEEQEGGGERRLSNSDGLVGLEEKRGKRPPLPPGSRERRGRRGRGGGGGGGGGGGSGREIAGVQSPVVIAVEGAGQPVEQTDVGGIRNYIAQMRARGHKRASSAPVHYQPPAAPSLGQPTGEGGKRERGKTRRGKVSCCIGIVVTNLVYLWVRFPCLHVLMLTYTHAYVTHAQIHAHIHAYIHMHTHTCIHVHSCTHICIHSCTHTCVHSYTHAD